MSEQIQLPLLKAQDQPEPKSAPPLDNAVCPVCGAMTETRQIGDSVAWVCLVGGYAHYYQARYGYLKRWFTSGEGNLREPVIKAMHCAA